MRHLRAIGALPAVATVAVPLTIVLLTEAVEVGFGLPAGLAWLPVAAGAALVGAGLFLMYRTISLFARVGDGTLAPWDPPRRFVAEGPYRHVRNPMISGVMAILLGEALILGSPALLAWFTAFAAVNAAWMPLVEEPGLVRRFGSEYEDYRRAVPAWVPRRTPYSSPDTAGDPFRTT